MAVAVLKFLFHISDLERVKENICFAQDFKKYEKQTIISLYC